MCAAGLILTRRAIGISRSILSLARRAPLGASTVAARPGGASFGLASPMGKKGATAYRPKKTLHQKSREDRKRFCAASGPQQRTPTVVDHNRAATACCDPAGTPVTQE
jgi:hypothetical protein